jgi:glutamyl-Q tRNA(Asp) synthetase
MARGVGGGGGIDKTTPWFGAGFIETDPAGRLRLLPSCPERLRSGVGPPCRAGIDDMTSTFRFAPSPNGQLHLGHAFSALVNQALARRTGGRLLLRIEDIDPGRTRPDFVAAIRDDLHWLGIAWDAEEVQSASAAAHAAALARLRATELAYPCFCTRADVARATAGERRRDPDGAPLYPGTCRALGTAAAAARIAAGAPHAWRLAMDRAAAAAGPLSWQDAGLALPDFLPALAAGAAAPDLGALLDPATPIRSVTADPAAWGDIVLARRDAPASYHLAVVVDDAAAGITEVVRGRDLYFATAVHRLLQALLGLGAPRYRHHPLVLDAGGAKLAKSAGATSLAALRRAGVTPAAIGCALGLASA